MDTARLLPPSRHSDHELLGGHPAPAPRPVPGVPAGTQRGQSGGRAALTWKVGHALQADGGLGSLQLRGQRTRVTWAQTRRCDGGECVGSPAAPATRLRPQQALGAHLRGDSCWPDAPPQGGRGWAQRTELQGAEGEQRVQAPGCADPHAQGAAREGGLGRCRSLHQWVPSMCCPGPVVPGTVGTRGHRQALTRHRHPPSLSLPPSRAPSSSGASVRHGHARH